MAGGYMGSAMKEGEGALTGWREEEELAASGSAASWLESSPALREYGHLLIPSFLLALRSAVTEIPCQTKVRASAEGGKGRQHQLPRRLLLPHVHEAEDVGVGEVESLSPLDPALLPSRENLNACHDVSL
eukprot:755525-Hanusia_phi.AAC.4